MKHQHRKHRILQADKEVNCSSIHYVSAQNPTFMDVTNAWELPEASDYSCDGCFDRRYKQIHQPNDLCAHNGANAYPVVFIILSQSSDIVLRNVVRNTWLKTQVPNQRLPFPHIFVLGRPSDNLTQSIIETECSENDDILQIDIVESKASTIVKTINGLEWVTTHCLNAVYIMKTDTDSFINIPRLLTIIHNITRPVGDFGYCQKAFPIREKGKWYMPESAYPYPVFPPYCVGPGHVLSMEAAKHVVRVSPNVPFLPSEDVYVGLCHRHVRLENISDFRIYHIEGFLGETRKLACDTGAIKCCEDIFDHVVIHPVHPHFLENTIKYCYTPATCPAFWTHWRRTIKCSTRAICTCVSI